MKINVCLSSDDNYAQHLGVTIASILKNAKWSDQLTFYILDGGICEKNKINILRLNGIKKCDIKFIKIDEETFKNCPLMGNHITIATYFRFLIPTLLPDVDKILYLDCDMIIEDSLSALFKENIDDYWIAGVEDLGYHYHRQVLGRETESFYINAGMILINLKKWREDGIEEKLFNFAKKNKDILVHQDQDVLNMVLHEKSKPVDLRWNVQDSFYRKVDRERHPNAKAFEKAKKHPAIIHWTGPTKPWIEYVYLPDAWRYLKYVTYTPWKNCMLTHKLLFKKHLQTILRYWWHHPTFFLNKKFTSLTEYEQKLLLFKYYDYKY